MSEKHKWTIKKILLAPVALTTFSAAAMWAFIESSFCGFRAAKDTSLDIAVETLRDIGSGPGYPLDDCPKCSAASKARETLNKIEKLKARRVR